jgi:Effector protein
VFEKLITSIETSFSNLRPRDICVPCVIEILASEAKRTASELTDAAKRLLDQTPHLEKYSDGIDIHGTADERKKIRDSLDLLKTTPSGKALLSDIDSSGRKVNVETSTGGSQCAPGGTPGVKSDSTVSWNPDQALPGLDSKDPRTGAVVLGHELCHANHNANGTNANGPRDTYSGQVGSSARGEERQTVGSAPPYDKDGNVITDSKRNAAGTCIRIPDGTYVADKNYSSDPPEGQPTENSIRKELGVPPRATYYPPDWPGGPPW